MKKAIALLSLFYLPCFAMDPLQVLPRDSHGSILEISQKQSLDQIKKNYLSISLVCKDWHERAQELLAQRKNILEGVKQQLIKLHFFDIDSLDLMHNGINAYGKTRSTDYYTPLIFAAERCEDDKKNIDFVKRFLAYGADINGGNKYGERPLHYSYKNPQLIEFLLDHGADINAQTYEGATTLFYTYEDRATQVYQMLLEKGALILLPHGYSTTTQGAFKYVAGKDLKKIAEQKKSESLHS